MLGIKMCFLLETLAELKRVFGVLCVLFFDLNVVL